MMIVTFYLSTRPGMIPSFHDRREMESLPEVGSFLSIGDAAEPLPVTVRANSETDPGLKGVLRDNGAWAVCQSA